MALVIPIEVNDFIEVRLLTTLHGQQCITIFRYVITAVSDDLLDLVEVVDAFETEVWGELRELMSVEVVNARVQVQKIHPIRYISYEATMSEPTGAVSGQSLTSGAAWVFRRRLLVADRQHRGRIYIPGIPQSSEADSIITQTVWDSTARTNSEAAMSVTLTPSVCSMTSALIVPAAGNTWENRGIVFDGQADRIIRYQRRREVGRGV